MSFFNSINWELSTKFDDSTLCLGVSRVDPVKSISNTNISPSAQWKSTGGFSWYPFEKKKSVVVPEDPGNNLFDLLHCSSYANSLSLLNNEQLTS